MGGCNLSGVQLEMTARSCGLGQEARLDVTYILALSVFVRRQGIFSDVNQHMFLREIIVLAAALINARTDDRGVDVTDEARGPVGNTQYW